MNHAPWVAWALLSAAFAALTAIFARIGVQGIDSDLATLLRTLVVVAALAGFVGLAGKWRNPLTLDRGTLGWLAASGLATGASWLCYFRALQLGRAAQVAPVDKLSVVLVAVFAVAFLGERPAPREWLGIALISIGAVVMVLRP